MKRAIVLLAAVGLASTTAAASDLEAGSCGPVNLLGGGAHDYSLGSTPGAVRVRSKPVQIPPLRLRFQDLSAGKPADGEVTVCYDWQWFRYPYPEKLFGAWEISYECRRCLLDSDGAAALPPHQVTPRGWYDGWLRFGRDPRFEGVRFTLDHRGSLRSFPSLTVEAIERLREKSDVRFQVGDLEAAISPSESIDEQPD